MNATALHVADTPEAAPRKGRGRKGRSRAKPAAVKPVSMPRKVITCAMGAGIPLLSLGLSTVGGTLAQHGHVILATASIALMCSVLVVSLSHLAWAISDVTRSARWASWALAAAFDLALVLGEMVHVHASAAGLGQLVTVIMAAVCCTSMVLNCWAFLNHPSR
jgi:hypothetical protein